MSRVEAFRCDFKDHLVEANSAVGINPVEDMFDVMASYPTVMNPDKASMHYCTECYKEKVLIPASNMISRKSEEDKYKLKVKELAYILRRQVVETQRRKNKLKKS